MKKPPLLDNEELIKLKIGMLDSLMEIEVAYNLIKGTQNDHAKDPVDLHYESLKTNINVCFFLLNTLSFTTAVFTFKKRD